MNNLLRKGIAEMMGVAIFVTAIIASGLLGAPATNPIRNIAIGGTLALMILITATVSGGHLNPAVSLFMFARKSIDLSTLVVYWIAQLLGGYIGLLIGSRMVNQPVVAQTSYAIDVTGPLLGEVLATAVLIIIIVRLASTKREAIIPFAVGLWVVVASSYTMTGAQANPAVTFALMIRDGFPQSDFGIIVAEFAGALLALLYVVLLDSNKKSKKKK
jgi:aquaporin Z